MARLWFALIILGGVLAFMGYKEIRLSSHSKTEAQKITCADLAKNGPGDNANVSVTDFMLGQNFCAVTDKYDKAKFKTVYIPLAAYSKSMSPAELLRSATQFHVILKTAKVASEAQLSSLEALAAIDGMVINDIASLSGEEKKILQGQYPDIKLESCWIVEHERHPMSMLGGAGMSAGGVALAGIGGFLLVARRRG